MSNIWVGLGLWSTKNHECVVTDCPKIRVGNCFWIELAGKRGSLSFLFPDLWKGVVLRSAFFWVWGHKKLLD